MFWMKQSKKGTEPSSVAKMAIGCFILGLSFVVMVLGANAIGDGRGSWLWPVACVFAVTVGELYLSPIGLSYKAIAEQVAAQISIASYVPVDPKAPFQKLKPREVRKVGEDVMKIAWKEGHESELGAYLLRDHCRCATCRNELTGEKVLPPGSVPRDITILKQEVIGNYALAFVFSDGHSTGIYSYPYLREICPCCVEAPGGSHVIQTH
jgi:DUF971 family protein